MNAAINATIRFLAAVISIIVRAYHACHDAAAPKITSAVTGTKSWFASVKANVAARVAA